MTSPVILVLLAIRVAVAMFLWEVLRRFQMGKNTWGKSLAPEITGTLPHTCCAPKLKIKLDATEQSLSHQVCVCVCVCSVYAHGDRFFPCIHASASLMITSSASRQIKNTDLHK